MLKYRKVLSFIYVLCISHLLAFTGASVQAVAADTAAATVSSDINNTAQDSSGDSGEPVLKIDGAAEEVLSPPYLQDFSGANHINAYLDGKGREVLKGAFFKFGERVRGFGSTVMNVLYSEGCWAQVYTGTSFGLSLKSWENTAHPRVLDMNTGWLHIRCASDFTLKTKLGDVNFRAATAWVLVSSTTIEIYQSAGVWTFKKLDQTYGGNQTGLYSVISADKVMQGRYEQVALDARVPEQLKKMVTNTEDEKVQEAILEKYREDLKSLKQK